MSKAFDSATLGSDIARTRKQYWARRTDRILQFFAHDPDGTMIEFQQHDGDSVLFRLLPENAR